MVNVIASVMDVGGGPASGKAPRKFTMAEAITPLDEGTVSGP